MASPKVSFTLIGGPTLLIEFGGVRLLTDPTFDPPGLYQERPVRFEKTSGPAIEADRIGRVDAVLLSHDQHFDNLDLSGRAFLPRAAEVFTTASGAGRLGEGVIGPTPFETRPLQSNPDVTVTATPARHGPIGIEPISGKSSASRLEPEV